MKKKHKLMAETHRLEGQQSAQGLTMVAILIFIMGFGLEVIIQRASLNELTGFCFGGGSLIAILFLIIGNFIKRSHEFEADNFEQYKQRQDERKFQ